MKVKIFLVNNCSYCKKLEKLLNKANIEFETFDIKTKEGDKIFKPIFEITQSELVPTVLIDGKHILVPEISFKTIDMCFEIILKILKEEIK